MQRARLLFIAMFMATLLGISTSSFGQTASELTPTPGYVRMPSLNINNVKPPSTSILFVLPAGKTSTRGLVLNDANSSAGVQQQ